VVPARGRAARGRAVAGRARGAGAGRERGGARAAGGPAGDHRRRGAGVPRVSFGAGARPRRRPHRGPAHATVVLLSKQDAAPGGRVREAVGVIGAGAFGLALARTLALAGGPVAVHVPGFEAARLLAEKRVSDKLP